MPEHPVTPIEVSRLVEAARAFAADLNDETLRRVFISRSFNWDRLALKIVALAEAADTAEPQASPGRNP